MNKILLLVPLILLTGCLNPRQDVNAPPKVEINSTPPLSKGDVAESLYNELGKQKTEYTDMINKSADAVQTNLNSQLGLSIAKVAAEFKADITGVKIQSDALVKIQASFDAKIGDITNELKATVNMNTKLQIELNNQININNSLKAELNVVNTALTKIEAKLDANVQAQAGINNKMDTNISKISAGGNVTQNQFTREMLGALQSANNTIFWTNAVYALIIIIAILVGAWIVVSAHKENKDKIEKSRERSEKRSNFYMKMFVKSCGYVSDDKHRQSLFHEIKDEDLTGSEEKPPS